MTAASAASLALVEQLAGGATSLEGVLTQSHRSCWIRRAAHDDWRAQSQSATPYVLLVMSDSELVYAAPLHNSR